MLPPWMIETLERERREREAHEQPALRIEIQRPGERPDDEAPEAGPPPQRGVVVIQLW
jgi:hypothetical protein